MTNNHSTKNSLKLAVQASLFFFPLSILVITAHEFGHGIGATLVGASFDGLHVTPFVAVSFISRQHQPFQQAVVSFAGSGVTFLLGLAITFLLLHRITTWGFKLFWIYLGFLAMIDLPRNMLFCLTPNRASDFVQLSAIIGVPPALTGVVGLFLLTWVIWLYSKVFSQELARYFLFDGYRRRFWAYSLLLGLPILAYSVAAILSPNYRSGGTGLFIYYAVLGLAFCALMSIRKSGSTFVLTPLPMIPAVAGGALFAVTLGFLLILFGSKTNPRGLRWNQEEVRVVSSNVVIRLSPIAGSPLDFLMRPTVVDALWPAQSQVAPNWSLYDTYVQENFARLFGMKSWTLLERKQDDTIEYFNYGVQGRGARRISLVSTIALAEKSNQRGERELAFNCDSLCNSFGLNRIEITCDSSWSIATFQLAPANAVKPEVFEPNRLVLGVQSLMTTKTVTIALRRR